MPNQFEYAQDVLRPLVPAGVHDRHRGRRRRRRSRCCRWSRSTGATGSAGSYKVDIPAGAARPRARSTRTCPGPTADAALGDGRLPRPGLLRDREGLRGAGPAAATSTFGPTSDLYKRLVERRAEGRPALPVLRPANVDPYLVTVVARVKKPKDAVYVRDEILRDLRRARATQPLDAARAGGREVERALRLRAHASTTPSAIAATLARFVALPRAPTTRSTSYYRALRRAHARATCRPRRRSTSPTSGLVVTTLSQRAAAGGRSRKSPSLAALAAPAAAAAGARSLPCVPQSRAAAAQREAALPRRLRRTIPKGKEGLAALAAAMIAEAGSKEHAHRRDPEGPVPDGRQLRRARSTRR